MATVHAFQIPGVKCWFWSNDHEPPHFHAKKDGQWEVKVHFLQAVDSMLEYESWSKRKLSRSERRVLCRNTQTHRADLLLQWQSIQERDHG